MKDFVSFFGRFSGEETGCPFIILGDRIYQIASTHDASSTAYLKSGNLTLDVIASSTLAEMESFEERRLAEEIFLYQKEFIAGALQREIISGAQIKEYKNAKQALDFVLFDVLPLMIDTAHDLGELLGAPDKGTKTGKEVIDELVAKEKEAKDPKDILAEVRKMKEKLLAEIPERAPPFFTTYGEAEINGESILGTIFQGASFYATHGQIFRLIKTDDTNQFHISIDGVEYSIEHQANTKLIEDHYKQQLKNKWKRHAITLFDEQSLATQVNQKRKESTDTFLEKKEFRYGNLGYMREGDSFYVYWETPKFAMQNPLNPKEYHPFPATKIGLQVYCDSGSIRSYHTVVIDQMMHPFLNDWKNRYEKICILGAGNGDSTAFGLVTRISTGINAFTNGLTLESLDMHGARNEDARYFSRPLKESLNLAGRLTREDAATQGYRITNEWNLMGKTGVNV